jgi:hypothetical protein
MLTYKFVLYLNHQFLTISQSTIHTISHASYRSFTPCCQVPWDTNPHLIIPFTPCCQVPWDVNPHLISSFTPSCQVSWDVNPHLIIVYPCCSCFMFHAHAQILYIYFHGHAFNTCFTHKT